MFDSLLNSFNTGLFPSVARVLLVVLPISMPFILFSVFWILRLRWIQMKYIDAQTPCLLEIKLPKEITKSPAAMEIFFSYLSAGGAGNYGEAFIDGKTRPWFSCEIVSTGGEVRFFVWCSQNKNKNMVEAQLYAQYPGLEIYDVTDDDYTKNFYFDLDKYPMAGVQYAFTKPDPYPIKTYIDYGLDKDQKDEYKIDPLTAVLELLGTLKKGENIWMQIMVRKHEKETWKHGVFRSDKDLKKEKEKEIEEIRKAATPKSDNKDDFKFPNPTKGQTETIAALERVSGKTPFDCMIRSVYIAEKPVFNPNHIGGIIGMLRQYGSGNLNGFKKGFSTDVSDAKKDLARIFPFLKKKNEKKIAMYKKSMLHAYKLRSFFEWPYRYYKGKPFVMSTEELATVFHFPSGIVSQTPTLKRVESKKSEAPANLPV